MTTQRHAAPFDKFREECGVFGIFGHPEAANLTYLGLYALQHRGQESAGIAASDGAQVRISKSMGHVADAFSEKTLEKLPGTIAIGHVRYSTAGDSNVDNAQPILIECAHGQIALTEQDVTIMLNRYIFGYSGSPLKDMVVRTKGNHIVQTGTMHKLIDIPFEMEAQVSLTPEGLVRVHPVRMKIAGLDGFVIVTAEYNRGPAAVLKNALDYAYNEWTNKPVAFVGYGGVGGARAIEQLRLNAIELQMAPIRAGVHIQWAIYEQVQKGKKLEEFDFLNDSAKGMLDQLAWWVNALNAARERKEQQREAA